MEWDPDVTEAAVILGVADVELRRFASGRVAVGDLVTHRFAVTDAEEAFARARRPEGSMKVVLAF